MLKSYLIEHNPLLPLENGDNEILPSDGFGAVTARAGVGKTAFIVQVALNTLLKNRSVLHISLNDPVNKVSLWYEKVFRDIAGGAQPETDPAEVSRLWDSLLPNRFIMTFRSESFNGATLDERLTDLTEQGIFNPQTILIDGLPFDRADVRPVLQALKELAGVRRIPFWFTVRTHRHEAPEADGTPVQLAGLLDFFRCGHHAAARRQGNSCHAAQTARPHGKRSGAAPRPGNHAAESGMVISHRSVIAATRAKRFRERPCHGGCFSSVSDSSPEACCSCTPAATRPMNDRTCP
jgi:hypothetical protein